MNLDRLRQRLILLAGPRLAAIPGAADELAREVEIDGGLWWRRLFFVGLNRRAMVALNGISVIDGELLALIDEWAATYCDTGVQPLPVVGPTTVHHRLGTTRADALTAVIDRAINVAGSAETAAVYTALREIALAGESPFTGEVHKDGLTYTDHGNVVRRFTRKALGQRLSRRRPARGR